MNEPTPGGEPHQHGDESAEELPTGELPAGERGAGELPAEERGAGEPPAGEPPPAGAVPGPVPQDGPAPLGVGVTPTGHAPVDAQLRRLEDVDHLAVSGHPEVYEDVHRGLRDTLTALDEQDQQDRQHNGPQHNHSQNRHDQQGRRQDQELNRTWQ